VLIATDDERIRDAVRSFGGQVEMTSPDHPSGTDRIAEVAERLSAEIIINLQGDEPQFAPADIDRLAGLLLEHPDAEMATLATPIRNRVDYENPNIVKVVRDRAGRALYFSRSPIPLMRDGDPDFSQTPSLFLQHLGVYAYRRTTLLRLAALPPVPLEMTEKLEQLRALEAGISIWVGVVPIAHKGVDTPADYEAFVRSYRRTNPGSVTS
jgi:3-deoxy-manno-octulosonate cytidylyltransferase (CMP-KDO synthetase)